MGRYSAVRPIIRQLPISLYAIGITLLHYFSLSLRLCRLCGAACYFFLLFLAASSEEERKRTLRRRERKGEERKRNSEASVIPIASRDKGNYRINGRTAEYRPISCVCISQRKAIVSIESILNSGSGCSDVGIISSLIDLIHYF